MNPLAAFLLLLAAMLVFYSCQPDEPVRAGTDSDSMSGCISF